MRIAISGGSGLVGQALTSYLKKSSEILILTRHVDSPSTEKNVTYVEWMQGNNERTLKEIGRVDVWINLAGKSINEGRWTKKDQEAILNSRIEASTAMCELIEQMEEPPHTVIQASAVGVYAASKDKKYDEQSETTGNHFLQEVVRQWEAQLKPLDDLGVRTICTRFGVILSNEGGALPMMALPYRLFVGGKVASGDQWVSWIHIDDVVRAMVFLIDHKEISGVVNFTSPYPVEMNTLGKTIAKTLHRPHFFPAPQPLLQVVLGKKHELVTSGQYVLPKVLTTSSFSFKYPTIDSALQELFYQ